MSNPNREVFKYHGQCTAECYNQFFNPNICHVCKSINKGDFILCDQCCLISYCSDMHKRAHHMEHAEICAIIAEILKIKPQEDIRRYNNRQQWIESRKDLIREIQQRFHRPMEPYIRQMILWSKSCVVCHQQAELQVCQRCFSANYCNEHAKMFNRKHDGGECDQFTLLLNIDIETISGNTSDSSYTFLSFVGADNCFEEMLEFCMENILMHRTNLDWVANDYVLSDYLSGPLTIYSGLKRIQLLSILKRKYIIIHIVSAKFSDKKDIAAWEILLHLLPELLRLLIVLIDPILSYSFKKYEICHHCQEKKKFLHLFTVPLLYHEFTNISQDYKEPHLIAVYHNNLNKRDTWPTSIRIMQIYCCPLFLSFSCKQEAQEAKTKIQEVLGKDVIPILNKRNHFSGLAPHRDLETGDIYFRNEHLLIYDTLYDINQDSSLSE